MPKPYQPRPRAKTTYRPTGAKVPPKVPRYGKRQLLPTGTLRIRRARRQTPGKFRLHKPHWIDPYPDIIGTDPEKRFFAALMQRRIYFVYHGGSPPHAKDVVLHEADHDIDFRLPEYGVIIDPFSPFAHSQLDSVIRDARKAAIFAAAGYVTYHPWAVAPGVFLFDQAPQFVGRWSGNRYLGEHRAAAPPHRRVYGALDALSAMPLLNAGPRFRLTDPLDIAAKRIGYRIGDHYGAGAGAVAAANYKRRKPPKLTLKVKRA